VIPPRPLRTRPRRALWRDPVVARSLVALLVIALLV
jgi:hypothetical protein